MTQPPVHSFKFGRTGEVVAILGAAFVYYVLARTGLELATINHNASPVWPPAGWALAILWLFGPQFAISVFLGAFAANFHTSIPILAVAGIALGNTLEAWVGLVLFRFLRRQRTVYFFHVDTAATLSSGLIAGTVAATIGAVCLVGSGAIPTASALNSWVTWWMGDVLGIWVVFPLIVATLGSRGERSGKEVLRSLPWILLAPVLAGVLFYHATDRTTVFVLLPILLGVSMLTNRTSILVASALICAVGVGFTWFGFGPFRSGSTNENLIHLQIFFSALTITGLVLRDYKGRVGLKRPALVLCVGWFLSATIVFFVQKLEVERDEMMFRDEIQDAERKIGEHMAAYEGALLGAVSLFSASKVVEREEWRAYYDALRASERYPFLLGMGVTQRVPPSRLPEWLREARRDGASWFRVKQAPNGEKAPGDHYIVMYAEPEYRNLGVIGLDLATDPVRRELVERAARRDRFTISRPMTILTDNEGHVGFLAVYPIKKQGPFGGSFGWVNALFRARDFFSEALGPLRESIELAVYTDGAYAPTTKVFETSPTLADGRYEYRSKIELGGQEFYFGWRRGSAYVIEQESTTAWLGALGAILSLILAGAVVNLELVGSRATQIAHERTIQLRILSRVNDFISRDPDREQLVPAVIDVIREEMGWTVGQSWIVEEETRSLHLADFRSARTKNLSDFLAASRTLTLSEGESLPGSAVRDRGVHWLRSLDPRSPDPLTHAAFRVGIQSGFAFPIFSRDEPVAVLCFFNEWTQEPNEVLTQTLNVVARRMGEYLEKVETERDLELQKQRLVQSSKMSALGEMAGGISHEVNNPLLIIGGRAELLRRAAEKSVSVDSQEVIRSADIISSTTERIAKIITGLRAFSRHGDGDPMLPVLLKQVLDHTLEFCRERFRIGSVDLQLGEIPHVWIRCRESQIAQVFLNLLNNAFDAVQGSTKKWIRVEAEVRGDWVHIAVMDSGPGVPEDIREKIMQPFFTTKEVGKGIGLGLSISHGIIQDHGGTLALDRKSPFTRFVMTVRRADPPDGEV